MEPLGHKPLVVHVVVVGPFEEEEEGIGITSNEVKSKGQNLDTPGYLRGYRVKRDVSNFQLWVRLP